MTRMSFYAVTLASLPLSAASGDWTPSLVMGGVTLAAVFVADVTARLRHAARVMNLEFLDLNAGSRWLDPPATWTDRSTPWPDRSNR